MMVINGVPGLFAITLWLSAGIAIFVWALGPPRRWWQGVAAWFGGALAGHSVGFLPLTPPTAAGISIVVVFFAMGIALVWLGFRTLKRAHGAIEGSESQSVSGE